MNAAKLTTVAMARRVLISNCISVSSYLAQGQAQGLQIGNDRFQLCLALDFFCGFGNLLIIDHGGGYMSLYGNNESLFKQVGQAAKGGETIAAVGNSGGNTDYGLYFEMRHQGKAFDPLSWVHLK